MCIRRETREKARRSLAFSPVSKPHTHITYMLRQCTSIVYVSNLKSRLSILDKWVILPFWKLGHSIIRKVNFYIPACKATTVVTDYKIRKYLQNNIKITCTGELHQTEVKVEISYHWVTCTVGRGKLLCYGVSRYLIMYSKETRERNGKFAGKVHWI